jgi:4-hydroxybenzoate polyprenyltransferase
VSPSSEPPPRYLAYLQLVRLPAVFTAMADILMGFLFTHGSLDPWKPFVALLLSSSAIYLAGMVLNDVFDYEIDLRERPHRPLPSGRISRRWAIWFGFQLLLAGIVASYVATALTGDSRCGMIAAILAAAVIAYDRFLKHTPLGPLAMGLCRFLNVLLGMSTLSNWDTGDPQAWQAIHYVAAGAIGVYVVGVTWFARNEAGRSRPLQLMLGALTMWLGIAMLGALWQWRDDPALLGLTQLPWGAWQWFGIAAFVALGSTWRCWQAVFEPEPAVVQGAVRNALFWLILLDTIACVAATGMSTGPGLNGHIVPWPFFVFVLLLPARFLGRWVYAT